MTELEPIPGAPDATTAAVRRRRLWWIAGVTAALVLLTGGGFAIATVARSRYELPTADLFGSPAPTASGNSSQSVTPSPTPAPINGPLNILIAGIDPRAGVPTWEPHADAVLIVHVPASRDRAYITSLPRDLVVDVPAFPAARFGGQRTKLTHAMSYGSRRPGEKIPSVAQGFQLLARTVSGYTGIQRFDAGAVLNFSGFSKLVKAVGGVDMVVDQKVVSKHRAPNGDYVRSGQGGPFMVYKPGPHHFPGWQALDYARQRYTAGGDYARQRHQQQLLKALIRKITSLNVIANPARVDEILRSLTKLLTFDGRGRTVYDFGYALRTLRPDAVTLVALPGGGVGSGSGYLGERLTPVGAQYFAALRGNRLPAFVATHPKLIAKGG